MTTVAMTADPIAPPTVRMLVFMPLATPVWLCGTAATTRLDIAANARPKASPRIVVSTRTIQISSWAKAIPKVPTAVRVAPTTSSALEP